MKLLQLSVTNKICCCNPQQATFLQSMMHGELQDLAPALTSSSAATSSATTLPEVDYVSLHYKPTTLKSSGRHALS